VSRVGRWGPPAAATVAFVALTLAVDRHATDALDRWAFRWFWPSGSWGVPQRLGDVLVNLGQPAVTAACLGLAALRVAVRERRPGVLLRALVTIAGVSLLVVVLKHAAARSDVHGSVGHLGGSYPSGHMVALLAYGDGLLRLTRHQFRARTALLAAAATALGVALLVTGTHWLTDVVAGALAGTAVITASRPAPRGRGRDGERRWPRARVRGSTPARSG
jgi:membrane-associated phospholipid phosphatase